jgi:hypothetical protein
MAALLWSSRSSAAVTARLALGVVGLDQEGLAACAREAEVGRGLTESNKSELFEFGYDVFRLLDVAAGNALIQVFRTGT